MKRIFKMILRIICMVLGCAIILAALFLCFCAVTTLKVKPLESMGVSGEGSSKLKADSGIKIMTWNIGYGGLDENMDCFLDGGTMVTAVSEDAVKTNMKAMEEKIQGEDPDIFLLQEIDLKSRRSFKVDELAMMRDTFGDRYSSSYACNFKAGYIPIPLGNGLGRVEAGISSFSKFAISSSERVQLPIPFKWPVSMLNLKRCLLVSRMELEGSDKELVIVNLHLEAYDDGEGKAKQLGQLMDLLSEEYEKGNYVIAGGDFNQTFSTCDYGKYPKMNDWVCPVIDAGLYPGFQFVMDDEVPTCRSLYKTYFDSDKKTHQYYMIDGFIVSDNIEIERLETLDLGFRNTDHNPVVMEISLKR